MSEGKRVITSLVLGLLAVFIILLFSPRANYQPQGILLPGKQTRPAIDPSAVVQFNTAPSTAVVMGHINIERHYDSASQPLQSEIWSFAQKAAADVGANAVVVDFFRLGAVTKSNLIYVFQATAYYVPQSTNS